MLSLTLFIFVAFLMLFLGTTVFIHDPRNTANRYFMFWMAFAMLWMIASYLENVQAFSPEARELFLRTDFSAAILGAGLIMLFVMQFLGMDPSPRRQLGIVAPAIILAMLSFSPWLLQQVFFLPNGEIGFREGIVFFFYAPAMLTYFLVSCAMLVRKRKTADPAVRKQVTPVAIGLIATTVVSSVVNLFLQNVLSADWFRIGIYSFLFFIVGVTWAISKHAFLRIRFVATEVALLGILAMLLTRTIFSEMWDELVLNIISFLTLLLLGFFMVRSFLNEVSQREQLEAMSEELKAKNAELRELDKARSEFVNIASHQLRTPVSVIKGYLALLEEGAYGKLSDTVREKVRQMFEMNERTVHLINNFLNMSRIEKKRIEFLIAPTDIGMALRQVAREIQFEANEKGVAVEVKLPAGAFPFAKADMEKVHEVLINLFDNAVKYSNAGIGAKIVASAELDDKGDFIIVKIADNGIGLTKEEQARLFEKYYRAESKGMPHQQGSGLGLYISRMFIEGMGGRIWIDTSEKGRGTTFAFALPVDKDDPIHKRTA